jgi:hypothetical protein
MSHNSDKTHSPLSIRIARRKRLKWITVIVSLLALSCAVWWWYRVQVFSFHSDRIGRALSELVQNDMPAFIYYDDVKGNRDEMVLAGNSAGYGIGCSYWTLQPCLALEVTENVLRNEDLTARLIRVIDEPCTFLHSLRYRDRGNALGHQGQDISRKRAFPGRLREVSAYLGCVNGESRPTAVLMLNIIEPPIKNPVVTDPAGPVSLKPAFEPPVLRIQIVRTPKATR